MFFDILTLFPGMFEGVFTDSIISRAIEKQLISISIRNIRDYTADAKHQTVDDYPYGGSAGMVMKAQPVVQAVRDSKARLASLSPTVIHLSAQGELLTHDIVAGLLRERCLILLCGRYKGIDQRAIDVCVDREISVGDYVLSGGEIPAMILVDAITRLIPGALGDRESAETDSHYHGLLGPPCYTRPEEFEGLRAPEVLIGGHHAKIAAWKREQAESITKRVRPDLWQRHCRSLGSASIPDTSRTD